MGAKGNRPLMNNLLHEAPKTLVGHRGDVPKRPPFLQDENLHVFTKEANSKKLDEFLTKQDTMIELLSEILEKL